MNVELGWESLKKSIQDFMDKKVSTLGENYSLEILDSDKNYLEKTEDGQFEYYYDSRWWLCFLGLAVFTGIIFSAAAGFFPVQLAYSEGWWTATVYNWQNIGIFVIGVPLVCSVIFGYIGSKSAVYNRADWEDIKRWDLFNNSENVVAVFYDNSNLINVKSFNIGNDNLAAEIASELSSIIGSDKLTLTVCGAELLNLDGKKFCQYCGSANPDNKIKCDHCGANLGGL
jgi:hypothetical protein